MVALQTLKSINSGLSKTQEEISTGKKISSSKDNAAVWSISKVMESDVSGIKSIQSSLDLGESTVTVARQAAQSVVEKLKEMQDLVISAQGENVDRATLQEQISTIKDSIAKITGSAQFNGLNLLDGSSSSDVNILASLNRSSTGEISTANITMQRRSFETSGTAANGAIPTPTLTVAASGSATTTALATTDNLGFIGTLGANDGTDGVIDVTYGAFSSGTSEYKAGDSVSLKVGDKSVSYIVTQDDIDNTGTTDVGSRIATKMASLVNDLNITGISAAASAGDLTLTNTTNDDVSIAGQVISSSGTLAGLDDLDVTDAANAQAAMAHITGYISYATDVASYYGSVESQISDQSDFMSTLSDAMTSGIGSLVDADMEEASARLTALQTQQQLGIQALSIANQQPQTILSLFR